MVMMTMMTDQFDPFRVGLSVDDDDDDGPVRPLQGGFQC